MFSDVSFCLPVKVGIGNSIKDIINIVLKNRQFYPSKNNQFPSDGKVFFYWAGVLKVICSLKFMPVAPVACAPIRKK